nr:PPOX class F420-dependent oxidoreductase [Ktedonobacteraceae bacterium]
MFSEQELAFLRTQPLARLATVAVNSQPDADSVGFAFENGRFYIGGYFLERTRKYKNIAAGQSKVSLLIDELRSLDPLEPRSIKLHGEAEILHLEKGFRGPGTYIVITPKISWSSGIEGPAFQDGKPVIKKIIWEE